MNKKFDGSVITITLSDVSQKFDERTGEKKITLISEDGAKFRFKEKKADGELTAAFKVYQDGLQAGDIVEVGFKEVEGEFTGDDGKQVKYKNNYVSFIKKLDNTIVVDAKYNPNGTFKPGEGKLEDAPFWWNIQLKTPSNG